MTGVRITICVFAALAGLASAQESLELRGRSIPENSIEFRLRAEDLAREQAAELGDDLESPWHNMGHTTGSGVAEDRTYDYEVWNQPIVALVRASTPSTPDQALWVVIRNTTEGIAFDEYSSYEEALRGVEKDDIKRGFVADVSTGPEVWNQGVDKFSASGWWGHCDAASSPDRCAVLGADKWWGICHGAAPAFVHAYDIEASFDGAMLAGEQTETTVGELLLREKGFEFVADKAATETTIGSDNFQTSSPGHKTVGELTLRTRGYSIYSTQKGLRLIVLVWDKDGNDVDLHVFSSVDGLSFEYEVIEYKDGNEINMHKRPGKTNYANITIRRGFINSPEFLALLEVGPFSDPTVDPAGLSLPGHFTSFPRGAKPR